MYKWIFGWLSLLLVNTGLGQSINEYAIVPKPAKLEGRAGRFVLRNTTTVMAPLMNTELKTIDENFTNQLNTASGLKINLRNVNKMALPGNGIALVPVNDDALGAEGYRIIARNISKIPPGMPQAGKDAWVAADEVTVD